MPASAELDRHGAELLVQVRAATARRNTTATEQVLCASKEQVHEPDQVSVRITVRGDRVVVEDLREPDPAEGNITVAAAHGTSDQVTAAGAEGLARLLAPLRLSAESAAEGTPVTGPVDFPGLLGIDDPAVLNLMELWRRTWS